VIGENAVDMAVSSTPPQAFKNDKAFTGKRLLLLLACAAGLQVRFH